MFTGMGMSLGAAGVTTAGVGDAGVTVANAGFVGFATSDAAGSTLDAAQPIAN